jgi:hypothetical protein
MWSGLYSSRPARMAQSWRGAVKRVMLSTDVTKPHDVWQPGALWSGNASVWCRCGGSFVTDLGV